jgi:hypothetical protein
MKDPLPCALREYDGMAILDRMEALCLTIHIIPEFVPPPSTPENSPTQRRALRLPTS